MATSVYTSLLLKDFRRKAGDIKKVRKELREMAREVLALEDELAALSKVIKSRNPSFNPYEVKPISTTPKVLGLKWNQQTMLILEALRKADGGAVSTNELTEYVILHGEIEIENRRVFANVRRCVYGTLKRLARKSQIHRIKEEASDSLVHWMLA